MTKYEMAGLDLQKAEITKQLRRVRSGDTFAHILLMGKIKDINRKIEALRVKSD